MNKLIVLLLLLFTTSCTVTMNYKSSKLRKSHSKIYLQVQKLSKSMTKDLIKRKKLYNSLNLENNNKSIKFQNIFNEMSIIIEDTKKEELIALRIKNDVYVLTNKRKRIKSNKPEWEKYNILKEETKAMEKKLKFLNKKYQKLSKKYNKLLKGIKRNK